MRLARLDHFRCGEPMLWRGGEGYTYVWVPDEMEPLELWHFCEQAQKAYLDTEAFSKTKAPVAPPGYGVTITTATADSKTVGELRAEHEVQAKAYKDYQATIDASRKPFAWHLNRVSNGAVLQFWEHRPEGFFEVKVDWGHNHGVTIEHSPTVLGDYPFPEDDEDRL
jgi:hypothetical protein